MKKLLINQHGQLRNGWWILIFVALIALTRPLYSLIRGSLLDWQVQELWLEPLSLVLILCVTWICCRLRQQRLADAGWHLDLRAFKLFQAGLLFSVIQIAIIVGIIWLAGGVSFELNSNRSFEPLLLGFYIFLCAAIMEELLFRGFIFQRLIEGVGVWPAQLGLALLFAIGHWSNPDMEGATLIWASLDIGLGAILWGLAFIRTGSLALPIGMHLGWNWAQGNIFGFAVSGHEHQGWLQPILQDSPAWLTGSTFGPEASVVAVIVDLAAIIVLWRWKGFKDNAVVAKPAIA
ncbi:MAG: lysostaphin resistance A-like protein [Aestuariibacter sp.]